MKHTDIRLLRANEIDLRVQTVKEKGFSLLLYKNARVDMLILDEVFGVYGWSRTHELINDNLFCTISIYDPESKQWIQKQDVGVESYTEKQKGEASDAFKRASTNVGIGRELYTGPFIWINDTSYIYDTKQKDNYGNIKYSVKGEFAVSEIDYDTNRDINYLVIVDSRKGTKLFTFDCRPKPVDKTKPGTKTKVVDNPVEVITPTATPEAPVVSDTPLKVTELVCSDCHKAITVSVRDFSTKKHGVPLCMSCQKNH